MKLKIKNNRGKLKNSDNNLIYVLCSCKLYINSRPEKHLRSVVYVSSTCLFNWTRWSSFARTFFRFKKSAPQTLKDFAVEGAHIFIHLLYRESARKVARKVPLKKHH